MITRALRSCAGRSTVSRVILAGAASGLAVVAPAASPAQAGVTWNLDHDATVIVVQPAITQAGQAMAPAVEVYVTEPNRSTPDPDFNGTVTLTYATNPDHAPEPQHNVARASHGVATFPALTFTAVGFGFTLKASIPGQASAPSSAFDIVTQLVRCQAGQSCHSGTVSSGGTSGSSLAAAGSSAGFLAATSGGFPSLSCTAVGGVLTFSATSQQVITLENPGPVKPPKHRPRPWPSVCWGAPAPFVTAGGTTSVFNPANGDYEGLLPSCGPREQVQPPCVLWNGFGFGHKLAARVLAPAGDPHITF